MDIKTKLEDEELFLIEGKTKKVKIAWLNKKDVYTVEDFLKSHIDALVIDENAKIDYRAFKDILSYKYLGAPLVRDVFLEETLSREDCKRGSRLSPGKFFKISKTLGFCNLVNRSIVEKIFEDDNVEEFKYIDYLKEILKQPNSELHPLAEFYVNYYEINKTKESIMSDNKVTLAEAKNEIVNLLNQRYELDRKIALLQEQIKFLEGAGITNGKK